MQQIVGTAMALDGVDIPYAIPNLRTERVEDDPGIPNGPLCVPETQIRTYR